MIPSASRRCAVLARLLAPGGHLPPTNGSVLLNVTQSQHSISTSSHTHHDDRRLGAPASGHLSAIDAVDKMGGGSAHTLSASNSPATSPPPQTASEVLRKWERLLMAASVRSSSGFEDQYVQSSRNASSDSALADMRGLLDLSLSLTARHHQSSMDVLPEEVHSMLIRAYYQMVGPEDGARLAFFHLLSR